MVWNGLGFRGEMFFVKYGSVDGRFLGCWFYVLGGRVVKSNDVSM